MATLSTPTSFDRALTWLSRAVLTRLLAATGFLLLALIAAVVSLCRMGGGFSNAPSLILFCGCAFTAGLFSCALRLIADWPPYYLERRAAMVFGTLVTIPSVILAISLLPQAWTYGLVVNSAIWFSLVGWFCSSASSTKLLQYVGHDIVWPEVERFLFPARIATQVATDIPVAIEVRVHEDSAGRDVVSDLQRRTTRAEDVLEGHVVATFLTGSRQTVVHIPFTPPFARVPHVECEPSDGSEVRIKVAAVYVYGARLELKRTTSDLTEQQVQLDVYAADVNATSEAA